jgi:hypothetical protein
VNLTANAEESLDLSAYNSPKVWIEYLERLENKQPENHTQWQEWFTNHKKWFTNHKSNDVLSSNGNRMKNVNEESGGSSWLAPRLEERATGLKTSNTNYKDGREHLGKDGRHDGILCRDVAPDLHSHLEAMLDARRCRGDSYLSLHWQS